MARTRWRGWIFANCARISYSPFAEISAEKNEGIVFGARPLIGVLALQGDVVEHAAAFTRLGARVELVKTPASLAKVDALVIPGGESTTVMKLLQRSKLESAIVDRVAGGMPLWGTCMGMIVASKAVDGLDQPTLGILDVDVRRNAFGRQIASAEFSLDVPSLGAAPFPAIFIRAPWIERVGQDVDVLAKVGGHPVFVRQGTVMATSFHPELGSDDRVHAFFLSFLEKKQEHTTLFAETSGNEAGLEILPGSSRPQ